MISELQTYINENKIADKEKNLSDGNDKDTPDGEIPIDKGETSVEEIPKITFNCKYYLNIIDKAQSSISYKPQLGKKSEWKPNKLFASLSTENLNENKEYVMEKPKKKTEIKNTETQTRSNQLKIELIDIIDQDSEIIDTDNSIRFINSRHLSSRKYLFEQFKSSINILHKTQPRTTKIQAKEIIFPFYFIYHKTYYFLFISSSIDGISSSPSSSMYSNGSGIANSSSSPFSSKYSNGTGIVISFPLVTVFPGFKSCRTIYFPNFSWFSGKQILYLSLGCNCKYWL